MRTMFRNTVSLLLLLPLLAGTLGISASKHVCNSSKKTSVKFYPELRGQAAGCCCTSESLITSSDQSSTGNIDAQECCKTNQLYFRANFQTTQTQAAVPLASYQLISEIILSDHLAIQKSEPIELLSFYTDTGPPPTGRQRVISFHQSKIPCPIA